MLLRKLVSVPNGPAMRTGSIPATYSTNGGITTNDKFFLGQRVRVGIKHWLRSNEAGTIIKINGKSSHPYLVEFKRVFVGGGIDGNRLWCDEIQ